jgi:ATP-dependent helicase HrpB
VPSLSFPDTGLPVEASIDTLRAALDDPGVAVLTAEPGAGKTTVVPLRLLGASWLRDQRIVVLEPRRVVTRAAARRMADLVGDGVGGIVGYRTRDDRRVSDRTKVEVVTEGVLTRRLQSDPELGGVGLLVFDEFHERNLQGDLGLALALDVRRSLRPDLRLLVMSATLDVQRVSDHLGQAPVVTSEGRQHPVEVRWLPKRPKERLDDATTAAVMKALREEAGDVLVFLPGAAEIRRVQQALQIEGADGMADLRPLFGALSAAEQDAALAPSRDGRRRVVIATDIAETSMTVEGVRVVVDAGLARVPRFDTRTGMTRLTTVTASKASADQRTGRAGRIEPGVAYRLWSKVEHAARRPHLEPEISQVDLAGLALELASWGVHDARVVPFLDPPPARAVVEGVALLRSLGAVDGDGRITPIGSRMVTLPLHPRLGHMVVASRASGDGWLACMLAALLEDRDVLRGHPDELPADLAVRLELLADADRRHPRADGRALGSVRASAYDLARRVGVEPGGVRIDRAGLTLALAYPDRVAQNRDGTTPGRFKLTGGSAAWVRPTDSLAGEAFVVAADLDGHRKDARIRLAAAIDAEELLEVFADQVTEHSSVVWDRERDDVIERVERNLGQVRLGVVERRAPSGPATERIIRERLRSAGITSLRWTDKAVALRARLAFLHRHRAGDGWADVSDRALLAAIDLSTATSRRDLDGIDLERTLLRLVPPHLHGALDRLAPSEIRLPKGRRVAVDYTADPPVIAVKVQDAFGLTTTPTVLDGQIPIVFHLLSPAGRPVQVTSDLEGFWTGSWHDVRKEMAGRYPKHDWPVEPR